MIKLGQIDNQNIDERIANLSPRSKLGVSVPTQNSGNEDLAALWKAPASSVSQDSSSNSNIEEFGRQVTGSALVDVPRAAGQMVQAFSPEGSTVSNWGKRVAEQAETRAKEYTPDSKDRGFLAESLIAGGRALPLSVAPLLAYAAGPVVGTAATIALFGGSEYQDTYDKAKAKGLSEDEARNVGLLSGAIQGGGEAIANKLSLGLLGVGKKAAGATIGKLLGEATDTSVIKPLAKAYGKALVGETLTENAQDLSTEAIQRAYGIGSGREYSDIAKETTKATIGLTTLLAPFGIIGHYSNARQAEVDNRQAEAINEVLDNPSHSQQDRLAVVSKIYNDYKDKKVKGIDEWFKEAQIDIQNNQPIRRGTEEEISKQTIKPSKINTFGTGEAITDPGVSRAYNKYIDTFNKLDPSTEEYKQTFEAVKSSLKEIAQPAGDGKVDPIKVTEVNQALKEIQAAHTSRERTAARDKEALADSSKAPVEPVAPQEEATPSPTITPEISSSVEAPVVPEAPIAPEETVVPEAPIAPEETVVPEAPVAPEETVVPNKQQEPAASKLIEVYHATPATLDKLDITKSKDFGIHLGDEETVRKLASSSDKKNIYSTNIDPEKFVELPDLDSWLVPDVVKNLKETEWFKGLTAPAKGFFNAETNKLVRSFGFISNRSGKELVGESARINKKLSEFLSKPYFELPGIKYKNTKEGTGGYSYLLLKDVTDLTKTELKQVETKDADSIQEATKTNVSSSTQPQVREEGGNGPSSGPGVRTSRPEIGTAKEKEVVVKPITSKGEKKVTKAKAPKIKHDIKVGDEIEINGNLLDNLPEILKSKYTFLELSNIDLKVTKAPTTNGRKGQGIVVYELTNGTMEHKVISFDIRAVINPKMTVVEQEIAKKAVHNKQIIEQALEQDNISDQVSTETENEEIEENSESVVIKLDENLGTIDEEADPDALVEVKVKAKKVASLKYTDEEIDLLVQLDFDIKDFNDQIGEARADGNKELVSELQSEKAELIAKKAELTGHKAEVIGKKVIKASNRIEKEEDTDPDGVEELRLEPSSPSTAPIDHAANLEVFNRIKAGIRKTKLNNDLVFEYVTDFSDTDVLKNTPINRSSLSSGAAGIARHHSDGKTYIYINGAKATSTLKMVGTIAHELVGHYGIRKIFDEQDGTNSYDNFLTAMLNNKDGGKLKQDILDLLPRWHMYLHNWKIWNVKGYSHSNTREENELLYKERLSRMPADQKVTFSAKDPTGKAVDQEIPLSIALNLADEYMAELAKFEMTNLSFLKNQVGLGFSSSPTRSSIRASRARWLNSMIQKVRHLLKKFFGNSFDVLTTEDLKGMVAESIDQTFEVMMPDLMFFSDKPFLIAGIAPYEGNDTPSIATFKTEGKSREQLYSVDDTANQLKDDEISFKYEPFSLIQDEKAFTQGFLNGFGDHAEAIRNKFSKKLTNKIKNTPILAAFRTFGNMQYEEAYKAIQNIAKGHIAKVENTTKAFASAMKGLTPLQNQVVFEYFTTKGADINELAVTPIQKNAIKKAKDAIRETGKYLADLSGPEFKKAFEENEDAYLHTSYLKYIDSYRGSAKKTSALSWMKKKKEQTEIEKLALGQIKDVKFLVPETYGVMGRDHVLLEMFKTISKVSSKNKLHWILTSNAKIKYMGHSLDIDKANEQLEQNLFIINSPNNLSETVFRPSSENTWEDFKASTKRLQEDLIKVQTKIVEEAYNSARELGQTSSVDIDSFLKDHYVRLPIKHQLGSLSNKYVRKEIANDLEAFTAVYSTKHKDNIEKFFAPNGTLERINRYWKLSMVGLNPGSWVRNFFGNFALLDLGTSTNKAKLIGMLHSEIYNAMRGKQSEYWKLAEQYGLFGTTFSAIELQDIYTKYGDDLKAAKAAYEQRSSTSWDEALHFTDERLMSVMNIMKHKAIAGTSKVYALMEGTFKTVSFMDYIQIWEQQNKKEYPNGIKGLDDNLKQVLFSKAANHANKILFDYSQVHSWVKTLRRIPFGAPFLTFTYKAGPAAIRAMVNNPIKFAEYATLPALLTTIAMATNDWDDDDIKKFKRELPDYYRLNSGTTFLPWKDSAGRVQILPLDYMIPWSQWTTAARKVYENFIVDGMESPMTTSIKSIGTVMNEFGFLGGPTPTALAAALSGKDSFTGRDIITPGASASEQLGEIMTFGYNMITPSWLSSHGWFSKMYDAFKDEPEKDRFGEIRFTPGQAVSNITGFGTIGISEQSGEFNRRKSFEKRLKEVSDYRGRVIRDRNQDSLEKAEKLKDIARREKMIRKQMRETFS